MPLAGFPCPALGSSIRACEGSGSRPDGGSYGSRLVVTAGVHAYEDPSLV